MTEQAKLSASRRRGRPKRPATHLEELADEVSALMWSIQAATGRLSHLTKVQRAELENKFSPAVIGAIQRGRLIGKKIPEVGQLSVPEKSILGIVAGERGVTARTLERIYLKYRDGGKQRIVDAVLKRRREHDKVAAKRRLLRQ
jgi:hypothetical protein